MRTRRFETEDESSEPSFSFPKQERFRPQSNQRDESSIEEEGESEIYFQLQSGKIDKNEEAGKNENAGPWLLANRHSAHHQSKS